MPSSSCKSATRVPAVLVRKPQRVKTRLRLDFLRVRRGFFWDGFGPGVFIGFPCELFDFSMEISF